VANDDRKELEETGKAAEEATASLGRMAAQMNEFFKVLAGVSEKAAEETKSVSEQMEEAAKKAGLAAGATDDYEKVLQELNKTSNRSRKELTGFQKGLSDAYDKALKFNLGLSLINGTLASVKSTFGLMQSMLSGAMSAIKGFIGLVDGLWTGLLDAAVDYMNGSSALRQAIENVRKEFGDLATNEGAQVMTMYKELNKTSSTLRTTGRSLWNTFGDFAERLQFVTEIATAAGGAMTRFGDSLVKNLPQVALLNKSLNVSNEALIQMIKNSERAGQDPKEAFDELAVSVAHLSKQFGVSAKMIGKNFDELIKDTDTFGHMGPKALASVATYAAKLNVEISTLKGLMTTFDTFEGAATAAGKLNEVLGIQVDTMKMINADNPAERLDMMRKAFEDTGKSVNDLSRHELKALSGALDGMPIEDLKNSLSMSTDDVNFAEIADEAAEAQKKMSPVEAMNELSKNIEKLIKSGELVKGGFFANFVEGISLGIERSKGFRTLMRYIGRQLKAVLNAGKAVGKILGPIFSEKGPLGKLIKQYKQLIDFSTKGSIGANFLIDIKNAFKGLMKDLETDPKKALTKFFDNLKKAWKTYTSAKSPMVTNIGEGFKNLFIGALEYIRDEVPKMIKDLGETVSAVTEGIGNAFAEDGAVKKIQDPFLLALSEAFTAVFKAVWHHLVGPVIDLAVTLGGILFDYMYPILEKVFLALMIKAIVTAMLQAVVASAVKRVIGAAMMKLGMQVAVQNTVVNQTIIQGAAQTGGVATAINTTAKSITMATLGNALKIAGFMTVMAFTFIAAAFGLYKAAEAAGITSDFTGYLKTFAAIGLIAGATAALIFTVTAAGEALSKMSPMAILKGVVAVGLALLAIGGLTLPLMFINYMVEGLDLSRVLAAVGIMGVLVLEAAVLIGLAIAAGAAVSGPQAILLGTGLAAVAAVLTVLAIAVGPVMALIALMIGNMKLEPVSKAVNIMGKLVLMAAGLTLTAIAVGFAIGASFGVGGVAIGVGFAAIASILYTVVDVLAGPDGILASVNKIKITNFDNLAKKIAFLEKLMNLITGVGKVAIDAAKIAGNVSTGFFTSSTTATKQFKQVMASIKSIIVAMKDSLVDVITNVKTLMVRIGTVDAKKLKAASVIAQVVGSLAQLMGSMTDPMKEVARLAKNRDGEVDSGALTSMLNSMSSVMDIFIGSDANKGALERIIDNVIKMSEMFKGKPIKGIKGRLRLVGIAFKAFSDVSTGLAAVMTAMKKRRSTMITEADESRRARYGDQKTTQTRADVIDPDDLEKTINKLTAVFSGGSLSKFVNALNSEAKLTKAVDQKALDKLEAAMGSADSVISIMDKVFKPETLRAVTATMNRIRKLNDLIRTTPKGETTVKMLLQEGEQIMKQVAKFSKSVDVKMLNKAEALVGIAEKDGKIQIVTDKISVNFHLNIKMETKEIAYALHKGKDGPYFELNHKYQQDPFFKNNN